MRFLRRTRNVRRLLYSPIAIILLTVAFVLLLKAALGAYTNEQRSREELQNVRQNAEELSGREEFLSTEIERLESPRGLEEELRNKYPVAKEGERMIIIVEPEEDLSVPAEADKKGFWSKVFNIFR